MVTEFSLSWGKGVFEKMIPPGVKYARSQKANRDESKFKSKIA